MARAAVFRLLVAVAHIAAIGGCAGNTPAPHAIPDLRVVWIQGTTAYIASSDTIVLEAGDLLVIRDRGKNVATGELVRVVDRTLAVVRITSGALQSNRRFDRLRVASEPRTFTAPTILRLAYPASGRRRFLTRCERRPLPPERLAGIYRTEVMGERSWRGVRNIPVSGAARDRGAPWPDTLLIRLFDDSFDEEIAVQRGEVDAAVFWPFEPSRYLGKEWEEGVVLRGRWLAWDIDSTLEIDGEGDRATREAVRSEFTSCPIVTTAPWRGYLAALGADSLVNLLSCESRRRAP